MNIFQKLYGSILGVLGKILSAILGVIMSIMEASAVFLGNVTRLVLGNAGGCLLLLFMAPMLWIILLNPTTIALFFIFIVYPFLARRLVSKIEYLKYITTEYLFDKSNYYVNGVRPRFENFEGYKNQYKRIEADRKRREEERARAEEEKKWEERFRQYQEYSRRQQWGGQGQGQGGYNPYVDPSSGFKKEYEENCDILGVGYKANKEEIKIAYRKLAKKYHPDLNQDPGAEDMFKKVNNAYEFLSDGNIDRYRSMS